MRRLPSKREQASQMDLVTIDQMVKALVRVVENPAEGVALMRVSDILNA